MPKKIDLVDNLRYIYCKDIGSGKQAGFDVQLMRDRLTEIRFDIDHIQSDIDKIINGGGGSSRGLADVLNQVSDIQEKCCKLESESLHIRARLDVIEQTLAQIAAKQIQPVKESN